MKKILFTLLLTAIFVAPAYSQMKNEPTKDCKECNLQKPDIEHMDMVSNMMSMCIKNADKIGLSDEQKKKINPLHLEMQKKHIRFQADLKIEQLEMKEIMEPKDFDIEKAIAEVKKTEDIKTSYHLEMLKTMKEVRSVFTDEQYKKLKNLMPIHMGAEKPAKMNHKH